MQVGKQLKLTPQQCLPMVVPFERFGNTSSSSTWRAPFPDCFPRRQHMLCPCILLCPFSVPYGDAHASVSLQHWTFAYCSCDSERCRQL